MSGCSRPRVRVYHQVRTAHLERAAQLPPAAILFGNKRYDFAEELAYDLEQLASEDPRVRLLVDPPRQVIKEELARSQVLVLPAQDGRLTADAWMFA